MSTAGERRGRCPGWATRRRPSFLFVAIVTALIGAMFASSAAHARSELLLPYAAADVWAAAVRFLRVDRGFAVREKDEKAGYVLFDFVEAGRTYRASLELVSLTDDDGRASTDAQLSLPDLPKRYEAVLLDQLGAKVRQERGAPPIAKRRPPAEPAKDVKPTPAPDAGLPRAPTLPSP
jgi:hypothetical protein